MTDNDSLSAAQNRFPRPERCVYWREPERIRRPLKEGFELVERYADESHFWRYLLKCRECGQLYFLEFFEMVDWDTGNDPQYTKYIPVRDAEQGAELARLSHFALLDISPSLCIDFPKEAKAPSVYWTGKGAR